MIFQIFGFKQKLCFDRDTPGILIIQNPSFLSKIIFDLHNITTDGQTNDEYMIIHDDGTILDLKNSLEIITNPTNVDSNLKGLKKMLHTEITQMINSDLESKNEYLSNIETVSRSLLKVFTNLDLDIDFYTPESPEHYLKFISLDFNLNIFQTPLGEISGYVDLVNEVDPNRILLFVGFSNYMDDSACIEFYDYCVTKKILCLFVDTTLFIPNKKYWYIDDGYHDSIII